MEATKNVVKRKKGSEVISVLGILGVVVIILAILSALVLSYVGKAGAKTVLNEMTSSLSTSGTTITETSDPKNYNEFKKSVEKLSGQALGAFSGVTFKKTVGGSFDNEFTVEVLGQSGADLSNTASKIKSAFSKLNGVIETSYSGNIVTVKTELAR